MREQVAEERKIAQSRNSLRDSPFIVSNQPREHVRLAVAQADHRADLAVAERWQPAESRSRDALYRNLERQADLVVEVQARRDVDVHADVFVDVRRQRLLWRTARGNGE